MADGSMFWLYTPATCAGDVLRHDQAHPVRRAATGSVAVLTCANNRLIEPIRVGVPDAVALISVAD
ncbi:hypothetical protein AB0M36_18520 [Actinoplanes sp. NPDC051346]|uniref:hypothetical protein n=1 Tax=Actinoplanes sp. NPDC051346 TaxID=3155048 RepID=UPI003429567E